MNTATATALCIPELLFEILNYLTIDDVCRARKVSTQWEQIIDKSKDLLWSEIPKKMKAKPDVDIQKTKINCLEEDKPIQICLPLINSLELAYKLGPKDKTRIVDSLIRVNYRVNYRAYRAYRYRIIDLAMVSTIPVFSKNITKVCVRYEMKYYLTAGMGIPDDSIDINDPTGIRIGALIDICQALVQHNIEMLFNGYPALGVNFKFEDLEIDEPQARAKLNMVVDLASWYTDQYDFDEA